MPTGVHLNIFRFCVFLFAIALSSTGSALAPKSPCPNNGGIVPDASDVIIGELVGHPFLKDHRIGAYRVLGVAKGGLEGGDVIDSIARPNRSSRVSSWDGYDVIGQRRLLSGKAVAKNNRNFLEVPFCDGAFTITDANRIEINNLFKKIRNTQ